MFFQVNMNSNYTTEQQTTLSQNILLSIVYEYLFDNLHKF